MKGLFRKIGFTAAETTIIITLSLIFISGLIIKYASFNNPEQFDYSVTDKEFTEKTKIDFDKLKNRQINELQSERTMEIKQFADSLFKIKDSVSNIISLNRIININTAYQADLMLLPGIGEVMADRIIEYREKNNGFKKIDELQKVKGIGEKKFAKIKPLIAVE